MRTLRNNAADNGAGYYRYDLSETGYSRFKSVRLLFPAVLSAVLGLGFMRPAASNVRSAAAVFSLLCAPGLLALLFNTAVGLFAPQEMTAREYRRNHSRPMAITCVLLALFALTSVLQLAYLLRSPGREDLIVFLCYLFCTMMLLASLLLYRKVRVIHTDAPDME